MNARHIFSLTQESRHHYQRGVMYLLIEYNVEYEEIRRIRKEGRKRPLTGEISARHVIAWVLSSLSTPRSCDYISTKLCKVKAKSDLLNMPMLGSSPPQPTKEDMGFDGSDVPLRPLA